MALIGALYSDEALRLRTLAFELGFGADIEGLQNACIDCCDDIHSAVEIGFVNTRFPCVRKASFHSRLAVAHHGDGQTHEYFFALTEICSGVSIAVKLTEISSLDHGLTPPEKDCATLTGKVRLGCLALKCLPPPECSYAWCNNPVWVYWMRPPVARRSLKFLPQIHKRGLRISRGQTDRLAGPHAVHCPRGHR